MVTLFTVIGYVVAVVVGLFLLWALFNILRFVKDVGVFMFLAAPFYLAWRLFKPLLNLAAKKKQ
jgi:hypothetical protein